jgi:hypothetical protein
MQLQVPALEVVYLEERWNEVSQEKKKLTVR